MDLSGIKNFILYGDNFTFNSQEQTYETNSLTFTLPSIFPDALNNNDLADGTVLQLIQTSDFEIENATINEDHTQITILDPNVTASVKLVGGKADGTIIYVNYVEDSEEITDDAVATNDDNNDITISSPNTGYPSITKSFVKQTAVPLFTLVTVMVVTYVMRKKKLN